MTTGRSTCQPGTSEGPAEAATHQGGPAAGPAHPAKFTDTILIEIAAIIGDHLPVGSNILDPFAGTGRIHLLAGAGMDTIGVELEPEWASMHPRTIQGDALHLPFPDSTFDALITSPCYGNRMADTYDGRDGTKRHTYTIALGRPLHRNNAGGMQWGTGYRQFHTLAWDETLRVLKPGALVVVNVSNHIRGSEEQKVVEWHLGFFLNRRCRLIEARRVSTPRQRHGLNGEARVDGESILVLETPKENA